MEEEDTPYGLETSVVFNINDEEDDDEDQNIQFLGNSTIDPATRRERIKIIQELLATFSLEDTMDYYRSPNVKDFIIHPGDFSLDSAMPASRVKERLISLMGTDVVKLNDRKYIDKLNARLEQEYQANCDKREEELAEAERQRMRKLIIDGVLKPEDLREEDRYLLQGKKSKKNDASNKKKKIKEKSTKVKYSDPKKPGTTPRPINGTTSLTETQMSRLRKLDEKSESGRTEDEREQNGQDEENDQPSQPAEDENAIVGTDEDNSEIQSSGQNFISSTSNKSEEPLLEELQKEETVAGLYKIAETLLPPK